MQQVMFRGAMAQKRTSTKEMGLFCNVAVKFALLFAGILSTRRSGSKRVFGVL
jgi:hypothetical protein